MGSWASRVKTLCRDAERIETIEVGGRQLFPPFNSSPFHSPPFSSPPFNCTPFNCTRFNRTRFNSTRFNSTPHISKAAQPSADRFVLVEGHQLELESRGHVVPPAQRVISRAAARTPPGDRCGRRRVRVALRARQYGKSERVHVGEAWHGESTRDRTCRTKRCMGIGGCQRLTANICTAVWGEVFAPGRFLFWGSPVGCAGCEERGSRRPARIVKSLTQMSQGSSPLRTACVHGHQLQTVDLSLELSPLAERCVQGRPPLGLDARVGAVVEDEAIRA